MKCPRCQEVKDESEFRRDKAGMLFMKIVDLHEYGFNFEEDAKYIVAACNAYPRLVRELQMLSEFVRMVGYDGEQKEAEELLKELGEEERRS